MLSFTIDVFHKRAKRNLIAHSKFYYFDAGLFRILRTKGPLDSPADIDGQALEGLIAQSLRAWLHYRGKDNALYFWRTRSGVEVDFVVYGEDGLYAIEVKNSSRIHQKDLKGLTIFLEDYPEAKAIFVYRGKEKLKKGNVLCLPVEDFLFRLEPNSEIIY